jgi:hypothetical protein
MYGVVSPARGVNSALAAVSHVASSKANQFKPNRAVGYLPLPRHSLPHFDRLAFRLESDARTTLPMHQGDVFNQGRFQGRPLMPAGKSVLFTIVLCVASATARSQACEWVQFALTSLRRMASPPEERNPATCPTTFGAYTFQVLRSRLKSGCAQSAIVGGLLGQIVKEQK